MAEFAIYSGGQRGAESLVLDASHKLAISMKAAFCPWTVGRRVRCDNNGVVGRSSAVIG